MLRYFILSVFFISSSFLLKGSDYQTNLITDSLKENANAIVRYSNQIFEQKDKNNAIYKTSIAITVLNEKGKSDANIYLFFDKFRELKSFTGGIYNASGKIVRKIKKGDLEFSAYSESLATDSKRAFYECNHRTYPYTVHYECEYKYKKGIISYPLFIPVEGYDISLEEAEYKLLSPDEFGVRFKELNVKDAEVSNNSILIGNKRFTEYKVKLRNRKAVKYEPLSPPIKEIIPFVYASPSIFCYDGYCGDMSTWNDYGMWVYSLLQERESIPKELHMKLVQMTQDILSPREKVKKIYEFLQSNTRYVSIQLGIGGFQPIDAATVYKVGFGDCKGLSNLMRIMLKSIGINSWYSEIFMGDDNIHLYPDYSSVQQTNHVILCVPFSSDTIWLECTSQTLPFGYLHEDIAGHDALVVTSDGGKILKLPSYSEKQNKIITTGEIVIDLDGKEKLSAMSIYKMGAIERVRNLIFQLDREQKKYVSKLLNAPKSNIRAISITESKQEFPYIRIDYIADMADFVSRTGRRLFVPIDIYKKKTGNVFKAKERHQDIYLKQGVSYLDTIDIFIPVDYEIENLPKNVILSCVLGNFSSQLSLNKEKVQVVQNIEMRQGQYNVSNYEQIRSFFNQIDRTLEQKLVLKKK